jgi:pilus assembly protein CpaB
MRNTRTLLVLVLAIVSGLVAGYAALTYLSDRPTPVAAKETGETQPVVVAALDLELGEVLEESDLRIVAWPAGLVPSGFAGSVDEVLGRSLITEVHRNEAVLSSKLADSGLHGLVPLIPPGMRALSVRVDEVVGVAGFVTPGTRVDVILIMTPPGTQDPVSKVILQNIQALAAGQQIQKDEAGEAMTVTVVTVLVTPEQAERLALASTEGRIQMALRNTLDLESVATQGQRSSSLFAGFLPARGGTRIRAVPQSSSVTESIVEVYQGGVRTLISY